MSFLAMIVTDCSQQAPHESWPRVPPLRPFCSSYAFVILDCLVQQRRLSTNAPRSPPPTPWWPPIQCARSSLVSSDWGLIIIIRNCEAYNVNIPPLWVCSKAVLFHFQTSPEHLLYWHRQSGFQSLSQVKWAYQVFVPIWVWENEIQCYTGLCLKGWLKQSKMCWLRNLSVLYAWVRW